MPMPKDQAAARNNKVFIPKITSGTLSPILRVVNRASISTPSAAEPLRMHIPIPIPIRQPPNKAIKSGSEVTASI
ncbi:hypothetical protein D3C86_1782120 [compost metagenome]